MRDPYMCFVQTNIGCDECSTSSQFGIIHTELCERHQFKTDLKHNTQVYMNVFTGVIFSITEENFNVNR